MKAKWILVAFFLAARMLLPAQPVAGNTIRERIRFDKGWRFALGHPHDAQRDFQHATGYFSYLAKAAYGDGPAAAAFDDRAWRMLDLPHDWAVELPFDSQASLSHGFKAIGRKFPENSVGWYRKRFSIAKSDEGKRISIAFDGVFRNSSVWVNGFYLGTEPSGYTGFEYNISEYLHYGGENVISVRVDASMEEGWFYEGAGIYRHVWLKKTAPLHVPANGTFVTTRLNDRQAIVTVEATVVNENTRPVAASIRHIVVDAQGHKVAGSSLQEVEVPAMQKMVRRNELMVEHPFLWSLEAPHLYRLVTEVWEGKELKDVYETNFGIRTIRFDANTGFYLNGKPVKIKGTNNHQDHAGVGTAIPDALQEFRLRQLKAFGSNAYRCSHNPPTPELLDACDRLGILVIDENRLLGVSDYHFGYLEKMMLRDRNHPSIISWSIGNEEWVIEGNHTGASIATTMQAFAKSIDSSRIITAAISGGWQKGISNVIDMMGVNYIGQIGTDIHHAEFPNQPMWGTEEGSTRATRGVYFDNESSHAIAAYDRKPYPHFVSIEDGWKHYAARDWLAGMFIWTGFDYRGEPTPYGWPSVTSYFGMMDLCGFPKDNVWYLKSWWTQDTVLHILPHWNWRGKEGEPIDVWVYSNCDEVELLHNKKSIGKQKMPTNGHLEWKVNYQPGSVQAIGYKNGRKAASETVPTTGNPTALKMIAERSAIKADDADVAVVTIEARDKNGLLVPTAADQLQFSITGPGRILGVGNGNPVSLEQDRFIETIGSVPVIIAKEKRVPAFRHYAEETAAGYDDTGWKPAFLDDRTKAFGDSVKSLIYRGSFQLSEIDSASTITYFTRNIGVVQQVYINGVAIGNAQQQDTAIVLKKEMLRQGNNSIAIVATPLLKNQPWETVNTDPGIIQVFTPAPQWKRKLFNGLAQLIVQSTGEPGDIVITAASGSLTPSTITIKTK